jgi:hypothetical protein
MTTLGSAGQALTPTGGAVAAYHEAKHRVFFRLHEDQLAYRQLMIP